MEELKRSRLNKKEKDILERQLKSSRKKTKSNLKNIPARDQCQTPPYALLPLLPYIPKEWIVWESAAGEGLLAETIIKLKGNMVVETDLERGVDFFKTDMFQAWDCQITNPPFSLKFEWLERSYQLRKPFALLMPFETWAAAKAQSLFQRYGINVILFNRRVNFKMPYKEWAGKGADYPVAWFCWGFPDLQQPVTYGHIPLVREMTNWMTQPKNRKEIKNAR